MALGSTYSLPVQVLQVHFSPFLLIGRPSNSRPATEILSTIPSFSTFLRSFVVRPRFLSRLHGPVTMAEAALLTDEQIDGLLKQAEARLRAKAEGINENEISLEPVNTSKARKP